MTENLSRTPDIRVVMPLQARRDEVRRSLFPVLWMIWIGLLAGCAGMPEVVERPESFAITDTGKTRLAQAIDKRRSAKPGRSGFYLLRSGLDAFVARAVLASAAERSIDAQYYLFHDDLVGRLFAGLLLAAADRGVRVRLLVDDMALGSSDAGAAALDAHANIEVRIFNPFSRRASRLQQYISRFGSVTRRTHNKSFTVDNVATIVGGRNIGNEYFDADPEMAFSDLDVLAVGPVVTDVSNAFDLYWNNRLAYPVSALTAKELGPEQVLGRRQRLEAFLERQQGSVYLQALRDSDLARSLRERSFKYSWGTGTLLFDHPEKIVAGRDRSDLHLAPQLLPYFDRVTDELIILSPYFVPGDRGVERLKSMGEKGVRVRVLTHSLGSTDVGIVHAGYAKYRRALLRSGVELYELNKTLSRQQRRGKRGASGSSKASLHAKSFVLYRERVFVGSLNLDPRSIVENTEIGMIIESKELAAEIGDWFDRETTQTAFRLDLKPTAGFDRIQWHGVNDGATQVFTSEPNARLWRRLGVTLLRLLPIESQL